MAAYNTSGSQNVALGYNAGFSNTNVDPHSLLLDTIQHIDKMLKGNFVEEISEKNTAVADAYAEFKEALNKFNLVVSLTQPNK